MAFFIKIKNVSAVEEDANIILFDGVCKLCNLWCRLVIHFSKTPTFTFIPMQSEKGQIILNKLRFSTDTFNTILYIEDNMIYDKSTAVFEIIKKLSFPINILAVLRYTPKSIRDFIYLQIAKNRYKWFGKYNKCTIPSAANKNRL